MGLLYLLSQPMVVLVDGASVEKALVALRLTAVT
jgi:hypothetical protein